MVMLLDIRAALKIIMHKCHEMDPSHTERPTLSRDNIYERLRRLDHDKKVRKQLHSHTPRVRPCPRRILPPSHLFQQQQHFIRSRMSGNRSRSFGVLRMCMRSCHMLHLLYDPLPLIVRSFQARHEERPQETDGELAWSRACGLSRS